MRSIDVILTMSNSCIEEKLLCDSYLYCFIAQP